MNEDTFVDVTLSVDTLSGASPNGAVPTGVVQTFTTPSGNIRTTSGNDIPLDGSFHDRRIAASGSWEKPVGRLTLMNIGASVSTEYDYTHTGIDARLAHDFNGRNTTLSAGIAVANDTVEPIGGVPTGLAFVAGAANPGFGNDGEGVGGASSLGKDVTDYLVGLTQVINRKTIMQFNFSVTRENGYLNDPYKLLSVVDGITGRPVPNPSAGTGAFLYRYEQRPDLREKKSAFVLLKRDIGGNVLDLSFRHMTDDWGITSQTADMHFRWNLYGHHYLEPHLRFYSQTAADFYRNVLINGAVLPTFVSADYRLGKFDAITVGVKYGSDAQDSHWSTRFELYHSNGKSDPAASFGYLAGRNLYPDLTAAIAEVSYSFGRR